VPATSQRSVTVSAPGKLILVGEHAVVYGRPALVAAIDLRLSARLSDSPEPGVRLDLPDLSHSSHLSWREVRGYARSARERWDDYSAQRGPESFQEMRGEDPAHVVKAALGEAIEAIGGAPEGLDLRVESDLPLGSGFGSSAATAVAVVAGVFSWQSAWRSAGVDLETVERLALEVERRQHGNPSGVDGATVLRGGVLWARKLASGGLEIEPVRVRSSLLSRLRVYDTGMPPEATGAVVAAVRRRREQDPARFEEILDRIEAATAAFRTELERDGEDRDRALHLIREAQSCLEQIGVVPEAVRAAVRRIENEGGAAKVSGAGSIAGPGAGSLLVYHPDSERLRSCAALRSYPYHSVHLGAPGFRQEAG
jgi:mevalonate kinase